VAAGYASLEPHLEAHFRAAFLDVSDEERGIVATQIERRVNAPLASSMGRLFDAAAAVLGVRRGSSYEGQAAMELEAQASRYVSRISETDGDPAQSMNLASICEHLPKIEFPLSCLDGELAELDPLPLLGELGERANSGEDVGLLAAAFHRSVGDATVDLAAAACRDHGVERVALGGGVFQNSLLLAIVGEGLANQGLVVLLPERLGPNDGAISYGQAVVAAARLSDEQGR
jgi:hydrogenase maturation protein HypF